MPPFPPALIKYKQGGQGSYLPASGYPTTPYLAAQQFSGTYTPQDSYLRLHATGNVTINFFGSGTQAPFEGWASFQAWLVATWTQDTVASFDDLSGGPLDTVLGSAAMVTVPGPLHGTPAAYQVRYETPEPLVLTRARKGNPAGSPGPWLNVYALIRDPYGVVSAFNGYNVTVHATTQVLSDWGTPP